MAATTVGWQWPVEVTAMPDVTSRYRSPSTVVTQQPCPLATCRSVTWNHTGARCERGVTVDGSTIGSEPMGADATTATGAGPGPRIPLR